MNPAEAVAHYVSQQPESSRYCVAYSGGMDSHVLLLLMAQLRDQNPAIDVRAVHVDHDLQSDSAQWAEHASLVCQALEIPLEVRKARYEPGKEVRDQGPEASARMARYAEFSESLQSDEHLLLAQHAEDQAETFLLQALRGSGPDGLSGIARKRRFAAGYMGRPLLACAQESLRLIALQHGLAWVEDPSNADSRLDRNYLRHQVMPLLRARWPAATDTLGRASLRCAAASQGLYSLAQQDLDGVRIPGTTELSISALAELPRERAYAALRLFVRERDLRMPRLQDLVQVMSNLVEAGPETAGLVNVREYVFRRHRDQLFLLPSLPPGQTTGKATAQSSGQQIGHPASEPFRYSWEAPFEPLTIKETGLTLTVELCHEQGIAMPASGSIIVKSRAGGELIRLGEPAYHKAVKKVLQESSVPPWNRNKLPLLYMDGKLAAIWNLAVAVNCRLQRQSDDEARRSDIRDTHATIRGASASIESAGIESSSSRHSRIESAGFETAGVENSGTGNSATENPGLGKPDLKVT